MGRMPWATHLWPGLPQIWKEGSWTGLTVAVGFAALVNLALVASLVWSELLPPGVRNSVWVAVVAVWGGSVILSSWQDRRDAVSWETGRGDEAFTEALDHYLKGNWFEAEHGLCRLLQDNPRDLDAGLMLATLLRRTGRMDEAAAELDRLERLDGSEKWELEIGRERELLDEARSQSDGQPAPETNAAATDRSAEMADAA